MRLFEPMEQLEENEEALRDQVKLLSDSQRKAFYKRQSKSLKDPDTYATLVWFFLGGIHHCYLGKYLLFAIELTLFVVSVIAIVAGYPIATIVLVLLTIVELPHLFFSQKIARQHNYDLSREIYAEVQNGVLRD